MLTHLYSTLQTAHCKIKEKLAILLERISVNKKIGPHLSQFGHSLKRDKKMFERIHTTFLFLKLEDYSISLKGFTYLGLIFNDTIYNIIIYIISSLKKSRDIIFYLMIYIVCYHNLGNRDKILKVKSGPGSNKKLFCGRDSLESVISYPLLLL